MKKIFLKLLRIFGGVLVGTLALLTGCQSKLLYHPRPHGEGDVKAWEKKSQGQIIDYQTSKGRQQAYLQRRVREQGAPDRLWIVCGGNAALALDYAEWLNEYGNAGDAFLMIDYPGYGACEGSATPSAIKDNVLGAVAAACKSMGYSQEAMRGKMRLFANSLGCAAALHGAKELGINRGVLISPFTSTMDMTKAVFKVNLGWIVYHRFDNKARLAEVQGAGAKFVVLHGTEDEVIPVDMSRELKAMFPDMVELKEIPRGRHNDLFMLAADAIAASMKQVR